MSSRKLSVILAIVGIIVVMVLAVVFVKLSGKTSQVKQHAFVSYYKIAEQHEKNREWDKARSAWAAAKEHTASVSCSLAEANGRKAYCEYRIGMTYEKEGNLSLAETHLKRSLETPASDINVFMGDNGAEEMAKDLSDVQSRMSHNTQ